MANKKQTKIIIGLPCTDSMPSTTAHCIGRAIIQDPTIIDFLMMKSCDIVSSRTWIVKEAIKRGATHVCFIDSDMDFPENTIQVLLSRKKDIIAVDYNKRKFPSESVTTLLPDTPKVDGGLYKVAVAGMGLMLIDLNVFKNPKLGAPSEIHPKGNAWFSFGRDSEGKLVLGEDAWFCNVARDAGYDIFLDATLKVYHLGQYGY